LNFDFETTGIRGDRGNDGSGREGARKRKKEEEWQALDDCGVLYHSGGGTGAEREIESEI